MRTLLNAAFLAGSLLSGLGLASPVLAADLDHYYEPRPEPMLAPPPPPCGVYRPCLRPYRPLGYIVPRYRYGYGGPAYARPGYDRFGYDHDGYGRPRENVDRYGYDRPRTQPYEHLGFDRLDRYGDEERRHENERYDRVPPAGYPAYDPYGRG